MATLSQRIESRKNAENENEKQTNFQHVKDKRRQNASRKKNPKICRHAHAFAQAHNMNKIGPFYPFSYSLRAVLRTVLLTMLHSVLLMSCTGSARPPTSRLLPLTVDLQNITVTHDEPNIRDGRRVFLRHCMQCHLTDGRGGVGADLTDDQWAIGSDEATLLHTIASGTTGGMPGWGNLLTHEELGNVTAYLYTINPSLQRTREATDAP